MAWNVIFQPKSHGDLGIKEVLAWNKCVFSNYLFELSNRPLGSIWHEWIHKYVLQREDIWLIAPKQGHSFWFRSLLKIRDILLAKVSTKELQKFSGLEAKARIQQHYTVFWSGNCAQPVPWASLVSNKFSRTRISFCAWLICLDRLPLKSRLYRWGLVNDNMCVFCHNEEETRDHLFG